MDNSDKSTGQGATLIFFQALIAYIRKYQLNSGAELARLIGRPPRTVGDWVNTNEKRRIEPSEETQKEVLELLKRSPDEIRDLRQLPPAVRPLVVSRETLPVNLNTNQIIELAVLNLKSLALLTPLILSERFTADDRRRFREQAGKGAVFKLSNELSRLCGETARREIPEGGK